MHKLLDPQWRFAHLYQIRSDEGIVKIRLRPEQQQLHDMVYRAFQSGEKLDVIILKNRQRGTSTHCNLMCLDLTAYYPGKVANTLADTRDRAGSMFENNVKFAWDRIPDGLKTKADKDNVNELIFSNIGSKYIVSATKSQPVDILHISEAPYFKDEEKITEAEQMLRPRGIQITESTAFGVGNLFHLRFMEAWKAFKAGKKHHRIPLFFPWYTDPTNVVSVHPDQEMKHKAFIEELAARIFAIDGTILTPEQKHFYDQKYTDLDEEVFQFYPTEPEEAFLHSGRPVFNLDVLKQLQMHHERPARRITEDGIEIFEEPNPNYSYGIGVDTAEGLAHGDNSVISVVCKETGDEVAQMAGKISAIDETGLVEKISKVCRMYENHLCVIERNNHGHTVIAYAKNDPNIRLYRTEEVDKITNKVSEKIGWDTSHKSKAYAISSLKKDLREGDCIPHSVETYSELSTFVYGERGAMAAIKGHKDDRVMALALARVGCREQGIGSILFG